MTCNRCGSHFILDDRCLLCSRPIHPFVPSIDDDTILKEQCRALNEEASKYYRKNGQLSMKNLSLTERQMKRREYDQRYREKNREKIRERKRKYYRNHQRQLYEW